MPRFRRLNRGKAINILLDHGLAAAVAEQKLTIRERRFNLRMAKTNIGIHRFIVSRVR